MKPSDDELDHLLKRLHLANARRIWRKPRRAGGEGAVVLPRLPRPAGHRGDRSAPADTSRSTLAMGRLPLPQDHRRLRLHLPVHRAALAPRLRSLCRLRHRGALPRSSSASRDAARHTSPSPSPTAPSRTASMPSSRPPPSSSTSSRPPSARGASPKLSRPTPTRRSSSSTRSATSPTAPTPPTCSSTSSTSVIAAERSMIFTTNKPLAAWGRVLHDEDLAQAIVDRVLERGRLLTLDGPSMRTRHLGLDDLSLGASNHGADNLARISGIPRPEFPEPTCRALDPCGGGSSPPGGTSDHVAKPLAEATGREPVQWRFESTHGHHRHRFVAQLADAARSDRADRGSNPREPTTPA